MGEDHQSCHSVDLYQDFTQKVVNALGQTLRIQIQGEAKGNPIVGWRGNISPRAKACTEINTA